MDAAPSLKIIGLPNTFLSPHIAGMTLTSYQRFFTLMVDELERFFRGEEPLFELTPRSIDEPERIGDASGLSGHVLSRGLALEDRLARNLATLS